MTRSRVLHITFCFFFLFSDIIGISTYVFETGDPLSTEYLSEIIRLLKAQQDIQNLVQIKDFIGQQCSITTAGTYLLETSISYTDPGDGSNSAIKICSSNVILDLNGQHITFSSSACTDPDSAMCGIIIEEGCHDITIKNATISGFPGYGIKVNGSSTSNLNNITLENITVNNCSSGIKASYTNNGTIKSCTTNNNSNSCDFSAYGIHLENCTSTKIEECTSNQNSSEKKVYGIYVNNGEEIFIDKCTCKSNSAKKNSYGINLKNTSTSHVLGCTIANNLSTKKNSYGIKVSSSEFCTLKENTIHRNKTNGTGESYGLYLNSSQRLTVEGNTVEHNVFGFFDNETESSSLFIKNIAYCNEINYVVNYPLSDLPIKSGKMYDYSALISDMVTKMDNIEINL
ncbi:right-handed parallel beta-helix repeat-containing protein [bacterium]|jgi:hypothetical protein|nr:right-handed parallel beta-helix repeat-containing protein [bacterium]